MSPTLPPSPRVLVCFAVREEARFFSAADGEGSTVQVLLTGMGRNNAAHALQPALDAERPALVLSCGFAGALNPALRVGAIVYDSEAGDRLDTAFAALGAIRGSFHCLSRVATTATEKQHLRASTGADAVEMESEVIRHLCRERNIPSATIRAISDSADEELPLDFNALMTAEMKLNYAKLACAVLSAPTRIAGLLRLQRQTRLAAQNLSATLRQFLRSQLR